MPPSLALGIWFISLLALFWFDPAREPKASAALWVPLTWLFFIASRGPTLWLGANVGQSRDNLAQALESGSPLDRSIYLLLMLLAFVILTSRSFQWGKFVSQNLSLVLFLTYSLLSVAWSDLPLATFKKWFRDAGVYMAILLIVTDSDRLIAVRTVLRRLYYLTVPLSIVFANYFPNLGRTWGAWGGMEITGVTTSKNMLGLLCLSSGIFFFWDTATRWSERRRKNVRQIILANLAFISMSLYLLHQCGSKTSTVCLAIGCLVIAAAHSNFGRRHVGWIKVLAPAIFILYLVLNLGFGLGAEMSKAVGGTADMSDRTRIWKALLSVPINRVLGCGYQSFWLGWRIEWIWSKLSGDNVFEAHDGYLQTYLDLGLIGLFLACTFLVATYRKICKELDSLTPLVSLSLGVWSFLLLYNVSEAALGGGLLWFTVLMGSVTVSKRVKASVHVPAAPPMRKALIPKVTTARLR